MTDHDWDVLLNCEPINWGARLAYSDWLEEQGRLPDARWQRWLATNQKSPCEWWGSWMWNTAACTLGFSQEHHTLLEIIDIPGTCHKLWPTRTEAEQWLRDLMDFDHDQPPELCNCTTCLKQRKHRDS